MMALFGYAGVPNPLYTKPGVYMLLGNAASDRGRWPY